MGGVRRDACVLSIVNALHLAHGLLLGFWVGMARPLGYVDEGRQDTKTVCAVRSFSPLVYSLPHSIDSACAATIFPLTFNITLLRVVHYNFSRVWIPIGPFVIASDLGRPGMKDFRTSESTGGRHR